MICGIPSERPCIVCGGIVLVEAIVLMCREATCLGPCYNYDLLISIPTSVMGRLTFLLFSENTNDMEN